MALVDSTLSHSYLATELLDKGRWTLILCQSRNGGCTESKAGMTWFLMLVYILLEKEA